MTATLSPALADSVTRRFARRARLALAIPAAIIAYLVYAAISFDVASLVQRARMDNAVILLSDFMSHKIHVTRDNASGAVSVSVEGETRHVYPEGRTPDWITFDGGLTTIDLTGGHVVTYDAGGARYVVPGYGTIDIRMEGGRPVLTAPQPIPDWISVSQNRINVTTDAGRFSVSRNRTETFRYFPGWELFFFTLDSPFHGKGAGELLALATTGDRIDPARTNLGYMASEFWTNKMWRHGDVLGDLRDDPDGLPRHDDRRHRGIAALVPCRAELHAAGHLPGRGAAGVRLHPRGGRADLDDHPVPRLRPRPDDRRHRHRDH
jgi:phosphonate transport system permease protein